MDYPIGSLPSDLVRFGPGVLRIGDLECRVPFFEVQFSEEGGDEMGNFIETRACLTCGRPIDRARRNIGYCRGCAVAKFGVEDPSPKADTLEDLAGAVELAEPAPERAGCPECSATGGLHFAGCSAWAANDALDELERQEEDATDGAAE